MDRERYKELEKDYSLRLTDEELKEGWLFCHCEWDGMLIHKTWPEAECCHCIKESE